MAIHIKNINAKGLGPLAEFNKELKLVNLIYGPNEHGKTFLVEFLIKSLFKNHKKFNLRSHSPSGKVAITGLKESETFFSPKDKLKLGDLLDDFGLGMPTDFSRLLVVKGAELDFDKDVDGGMEKDSIKSFLSNEMFLDKVQGKIQATIRNAKVESGIVSGANTGLIKKRNSIKAEVKGLETLCNEISEQVSGSFFEGLVDDEKKLKDQILQQENAKKHRAYKIFEKLKLKKNKLTEYEIKNFEQIKSDFNESARFQEELQQISVDLKQAIEKSKDFEWLKNSGIMYDKLTKMTGGKTKSEFEIKWILLWGGLLAITLGAILSPINQSFLYLLFPGIPSALIGGAMLYMDNQKRNSNFESHSDQIELERLKKDFKNRTGQNLGSKVSIETLIREKEKFYFLIENYQDKLKTINRKLKALTSGIKLALNGFDILEQTEEKFGQMITELGNRKNTLIQEVRTLENEFNRLNVLDDDLIEKYKGPEYNSNDNSNLQERLIIVQNNLDQEEKLLSDLKTEVRVVLKLDENPSWAAALEGIQNNIALKQQELNQVKGQIVAGYVVNQVIEEIKTHEDEKIDRALKHPDVLAPIKEVTGVYEGVYLDGDKIMVSGDFEDFELRELSTGAREQVLLGIRLGLISKLFGNSQGFIILDDAFQHSDYGRRQNLVNKMFALAESGWQILYFSMDDHIASLFDGYGERIFEKYQRINL